MTRCLHITIQEPYAVVPGLAAAYGAPRNGLDPSTNDVMPRPDDPSTNDVMPRPDDPSTNDVMPRPDDPSTFPYAAYSAYPTGSGYGAAAVVSGCSCCCGGAASDHQSTEAGNGAKAPNPFVTARDYSGFVIVRMAEGVVAKESVASSLWALAEEHQPELTGLKTALSLPSEIQDSEPEQNGESPEPPGVLVSQPLIELQGLEEEDCEGPMTVPLPRDQCLELIRALEKKAATTAFPPLHSLTAYWRLDLREHPDLVANVVARLNNLAEVDLAYRELISDDPTVAGQLLAEDQGYLADAPVGISAPWAWESLQYLMDLAANAWNPQVTVCDLEQGWTKDHQDFQYLNLQDPFYGANRAPDEGSTGFHGTAVLGQLAAAGTSQLGIKGAAADLGKFVLASHYLSKTADSPFAGTNGHVAAAILQALPAPPGINGASIQSGPLQEGDVLLLEVQRALLPTEVDDADLDAIRLASAQGIIVVEAAGNGGYDLDAYSDPDTHRTLRRGAPGFRDSGAIFVGAARAGLPHDRASFSNYGSRLDCFGWGETVTTCGYGDLAGTVATDFYTNVFSGTSSASPIVAGAAALVQALHKAQSDYNLRPREMRAILSDPVSGTRQGSNVPGFIGIMPDLKAIVRGRLQLVPDVYMRRHPDDDGATPGRDEEISSSPDILVWTGTKDPATHFGEGPRANNPAPGTPIDPDDPDTIYEECDLYIRLRNRGRGEGKARVQLFASPAATLITPERWMPFASVDVEQIAEGDTLTVSSPVQVIGLPDQWPQTLADWPDDIVPAYSFLAVQLSCDGASPDYAPGYEPTVMLPPGPPYFDWARYRSFLRGAGVTWRNVHPIEAADDMTLSFLFAGTPDQTRHFDFEVIQRLPAGATVALKVPGGLAAKLRQRQPWLTNGSTTVANGWPMLTLPRRPRTTLSQVALAPGIYAPAAFQVTSNPNTIRRGHSLAIRQLWRGEEVGRITWWFIDP